MANISDKPHSYPTSESRRARQILVGTIVALCVWGIAIAQWGLPALFLPAVALVPILMFTLVLISRG